MAKFQLPTLNGEENYQIWEIQMRSYLTLADLLHCIHSEPINPANLQLPAVNKAENQHQRPTVDQDNKTLATLRLCCSSGPLRVITTSKSAKEAWEALKEAYAPEGYSTQQIYISELLDVNPENFEDMESFVERVRFLTQQLPEFGIKIPEAVTIELVRKRLPKRFNIFAQTLLAQLKRNKSGYTLKELLNEVLDEDRKTKADTTIKVNFTRKATTGQSLGKVVKKPWKKTKGHYCKYCEKTSHNTKDC